MEFPKKQNLWPNISITPIKIYDSIFHISTISQASSTYGLRFVSNNTSKRSQKSIYCKDPKKGSQKDSHKDSHKDSQKDSHKDSQKDNQKDLRKDSQKDSPSKQQEEVSSPVPCNSQIGGGHCFTVSYDFLPNLLET